MIPRMFAKYINNTGTLVYDNRVFLSSTSTSIDHRPSTIDHQFKKNIPTMEDSIETDFHNICWFCGDSPCEWVKWGEEIKQ